MKLTDLHNPEKIVRICTKDGCVELSENQGFQEYPGSIELWEQLLDGRLIRICRWLKKSISFIWKE